MNADKPDRIVFNTDTLPERDRFPAFCEDMYRHIVGADIVQLGTTPFRGALDIRRAGELIIAEIATTSADMIRGSTHISDGDDSISVLLWRQGLGGSTHSKYENKIGVCDGLIIDNAKVAKIHAQESSRFIALTVPRYKLTGLRPDVRRLVGRKLNNDLSLRLLTGYLEGAFAQDFDSHPATQLFGNHLVDLITLTLADEDSTPELERLGGVRAARLAAILQTISTLSADPMLNAAKIAARLGITPRYVHLLLEQSGQTFTQHVLQKRLKDAAKLLADDERKNRKIADIALEAGFTDLSHFNRSFRRHFGDTPSGVRANGIKHRIWR
jgi:AraC-like DNA-binding protein